MAEERPDSSKSIKSEKSTKSSGKISSWKNDNKKLIKLELQYTVCLFLLLFEISVKKGNVLFFLRKSIFKQNLLFLFKERH